MITLSGTRFIELDQKSFDEVIEALRLLNLHFGPTNVREGLLINEGVDFNKRQASILGGTLLYRNPVKLSPERIHYMLQFFKFEHLPDHLKQVSKDFYFFAKEMDENLPANPEKTAGLRKLLEAKDCAVRAVLFDNDAL